MPSVKVIMLPITGPGDVLKIQEILAEVLRDGEVKDMHGIGCACGGKGCDKRLEAYPIQEGKVGLVVMRGPEIVTGIILDADGKKRLVEQLGKGA